MQLGYSIPDPVPGIDSSPHVAELEFLKSVWGLGIEEE
jgi:hypothetical protein